MWSTHSQPVGCSITQCPLGFVTTVQFSHFHMPSLLFQKLCHCWLWQADTHSVPACAHTRTHAHSWSEAMVKCCCGLAKCSADSASFEWSHRDLACVCVCVLCVLCVSLGPYPNTTAFAILTWNHDHPAPLSPSTPMWPTVWAQFGSCTCTHTHLPTPTRSHYTPTFQGPR